MRAGDQEERQDGQRRNAAQVAQRFPTSDEAGG
jgi:hypothetical protein